MRRTQDHFSNVAAKDYITWMSSGGNMGTIQIADHSKIHKIILQKCQAHESPGKTEKTIRDWERLNAMHEQGLKIRRLI